MVHEIVMMLLCFPSRVVTSTTGPGSSRVKALSRGKVSMRAPLAHEVDEPLSTIRDAPPVAIQTPSLFFNSIDTEAIRP